MFYTKTFGDYSLLKSFYDRIVTQLHIVMSIAYGCCAISTTLRIGKEIHR